nr:hypothetical protein [Tanacetum cinerariifolium]
FSSALFYYKVVATEEAGMTSSSMHNYVETSSTKHEIKAPNMEAGNRQGKEKIEYFGVNLEDLNEKEYHDSRQLHPIKPNRKEGSTLNKGINIQTEDTSSTSSENLVIV